MGGVNIVDQPPCSYRQDKRGRPVYRIRSINWTDARRIGPIYPCIIMVSPDSHHFFSWFYAQRQLYVTSAGVWLWDQAESVTTLTRHVPAWQGLVTVSAGHWARYNITRYTPTWQYLLSAFYPDNRYLPSTVSPISCINITLYTSAHYRGVL